MNPGFWSVVGELGASSRVVVDRPRGSAHPGFPENIYPLDYGFPEDTTSGDGQGIDVWLGSSDTHHLTAVLCIADLKKRDTELKLLLGCTLGEMQTIFTFLNGHPSFQSLLVPRPHKEP